MRLGKPKTYRRIWKVIKTNQEAEAGLASDAPELRWGKVGGCDPPGPRVKADAALSAPGLCHSHPCTADQQQDFDAEAEEFPFSWDLGWVGG